MVVRKKRKANASASVKTPEDDAAAETARVGVDTGPIADGLEHKVVSLEKNDQETTIGEAELDNAVVVRTDSVITTEKEELINDAVTISHNELHGFKSIAAEDQANEEVVTEGGEANGDEEEDFDRPLEYGVDGINDNGDFDENGDKNNDDGLEDNEAETVEEDGEDNEAATEEEDEEDNEAEIEEEDGVEADEDEDEDEDEEELEEDDDIYDSDDEDEVENENKEEDIEEDVKLLNDEVDMGNKIKEEVKDDKTKKEGVDSLKERLKKKANAAKDKNIREKLSGGSALAGLKSEHKEVHGDQHVTVEKADGEKTKENSRGGSTKRKSNKFIEEAVEGRSEKVASEGVTIGEADKAKAKEENGRGGGSSKQKSKKLKKESRMKSVEASSKKVASEREDKPEPGSKKKSVKKVKSMGMIFMCSTKTKDDCYRYKVLGLPASKKETVEKIYKGMRLFLYDVDLKLLYGIYKAAGPGGFNIQPKAFNSQFPSQVRFTILEDCLPLAEEKFKRVIRENYYTKKKFETLLTSKQVRDLCKLFLAAGKPGRGRGSKKLGRKQRAPISTDRDRSRYRDEDLRAVLNVRRRHQEYSPYRERAVVLPPVRPASRLPPLPPASAAPLPYNYDRALVVDDYRRDPRVEHRDSYRQDAYVQQLDPYRLPELERRDAPRDAYRLQPELERCDAPRDAYRLQPELERRDAPRDAYRLQPELERRDAHRDAYRLQPRLDPVDYRRDVVVRRHDLRSLDDYRRPEPVVSYRGIADSVDSSIRRLDAYDPYRERAAYRDPVYSTDVLPERDDYGTVSRLTTSYLPEYRSVRTRYRY